ncbi:MAG: redoxin family protein, partial [Burkholderiales bacterium]|nr:redoxin family protein [Burkholderiales bacterium]
TGSVRMMADGAAEFTKAVGMDLDLTKRGLGVRSRRYSMLLDDGIIKTINLEDAPGGMEVSDADTMLDQV